MDRLMDSFSDTIWRQLERETELLYVNNLCMWDTEWTNQWTSAWNYDEIYMWYNSRRSHWEWTDGLNGRTLV